MYGGYRKYCAGGKTFTNCSFAEMRKTDSSEAFVYQNGAWNIIEALSPCRHPDYRLFYSTCAKRRKNNGYEIIIPGFDAINKERCTAIFDMETYQWSKLDDDVDRLAVEGGVAVSVANNSRVLYLGGISITLEKLNTVYELVDHERWKLLEDAQLPVSYVEMGPHGSYFPVHIEHCKP